MKSKAVKKGESGVSLHATIINNVFDSHRRSIHYSIRLRNPKLYENIFKETKEIPLDILEKSYDIYKRAKREDKLPHPNYFLKVAVERWAKLKKEEQKEAKQVWGKTI